MTSSQAGLPTAGGIGDDVYSVGFDGAHYWVGGQAIPTSLTSVCSSKRQLTRQEEHVVSPNQSPTPPSSTSVEEDESQVLSVNVGDVIGCCLDLDRGVASFLKNGDSVNSHVEFHHCCKRITPALSFSAGIK